MAFYSGIRENEYYYTTEYSSEVEKLFLFSNFCFLFRGVVN
jgi:hypothetical protein